MAKEFKLSAERLEELKQELNYLKTVREKAVSYTHLTLPTT